MVATLKKEVSEMRREYKSLGLRKKDLANDPYKQFDLWFRAAKEVEEIEPNAMVLSTATLNGKPSCRMVLMKHYGPEGIYFFTNYNSRKAQELEENPRVSALFFWSSLERQVIIEGTIEKLDREESENYFSKRPRASQLGAWTSEYQSSPVPSREGLEKIYREKEELFSNREIPCPPFWGGYKIVPESFEFWQGRENRLHDRLKYKKNNEIWQVVRLFP